MEDLCSPTMCRGGEGRKGLGGNPHFFQVSAQSPLSLRSPVGTSMKCASTIVLYSVPCAVLLHSTITVTI